ncbi:hypothetical protein MNV49_003807 [Pseudohyphozyma bogoriensis]|nr:hypothetical protein MNV49_003807 [Pseudohyphozyma bogoriensis]
MADPAPAPAAPATTAEQPQEHVEDAPPAESPATTPTPTPPPVDDKVVLLGGMFPDLPRDVVQAVLDTHGGSVDEASESLLAMSDPTISQEDADAALAQQLMEEDRATLASQRQQQRSAAPPPAQPYVPTYAAYVPKNRRTTTPGSGGAAAASSPVRGEGNGGGQGKDELDQLGEQFSKLAEQGKKTLGGLFSKVKTQINKLDQPQAGGSGSYSSDYAPQGTPTRQAPTSQVPDLLPRPAGVRQASPTPPAKETPLPAVPVETTSVPSTTATESTPAPAPSPKNEEPTPAAPEEPKKDFSKIGLLPRQSINLERKDKDDKGHESDDSEDLEYVRSPFDDD